MRKTPLLVLIDGTCALCNGTAAWLAAIGDAYNVDPARVAAAQNAFLPAIKGAL